MILHDFGPAPVQDSATGLRLPFEVRFSGLDWTGDRSLILYLYRGPDAVAAVQIQAGGQIVSDGTTQAPLTDLTPDSVFHFTPGGVTVGSQTVTLDLAGVDQVQIYATAGTFTGCGLWTDRILVEALVQPAATGGFRLNTDTLAGAPSTAPGWEQASTIRIAGLTDTGSGDGFMSFILGATAAGQPDDIGVSLFLTPQGSASLAITRRDDLPARFLPLNPADIQGDIALTLTDTHLHLTTPTAGRQSWALTAAERAALGTWSNIPETGPERRWAWGSVARYTGNVAELADRDTATQWVPIQGQAQSVGIRRGSDRDGLTVSASVGTLTVQLLDAPDIGVKPSTPIRVTDSTGEPIFTGVVQDLHRQNQRIGASDRTREYTTITAADAVQVIANTDRYGAVIEAEGGFRQTVRGPWYRAWTDFEYLGDRFDRYMSRLSLPYECPRPVWRELWHTIDRSAWTAPGPNTRVVTTISQYGDQSEFRNGWPANASVQLEEGNTYAPRANAGGGSSPATEATLRRDFPLDQGFAPDTPIRVEAWVRLESNHPGGEVPEQWSIGAYLGGGGATRAPFTLRRDEWQHVAVIVPARSAALSTSRLIFTIEQDFTTPADQWWTLQVSGLTITHGTEDPATGHPVQSTVYESTLVNHLDLMANSTRGAWWVDRHGVVKARGRPTGDPVLHLADDGTGDYSFVSIDHSFDTAGIVNSLSLENHGRQEDPDQPGNFIADDWITPPVTDGTSIATYGERGSTLQTVSCIQTEDLSVTTGLPRGYWPLVGQELRLMRDYVRQYREPVYLPRRVRLHVPAAPPVIDVQDMLSVTFKGASHDMRVVNIEHEISQHEWHINLELIGA